jgi:pyruvate formate-lyase activating enzyme-like uncharacterized protein
MPFQNSGQKRQALIKANLDEYGPGAAGLAWITPEKADAAESERAGLLRAVGPDLIQVCQNTKLHLGPLSPGCRICSQGDWSCLFVNGRCNCRCFYCPSPQDDVSVPTTNRLTFNKAGDYADYVGAFGFKGISISGGEPLLTFERSRTYIEAVRRQHGDGLHIWLYTNGVLLTREKLTRLHEAGLNEIRFDISAVDYSLDQVALAPGLIDCVTIEIPAIPEDFHRLVGLLPHIKALGVDHLNLHQLRLTPHNAVHFKDRPYTYLHGEKVTVLESESAALRLLAHTQAQGIGLPVNYCSFAYKHRYQGMAVRRRHARQVVKGHESVTGSGYIRTLELWAAPDVNEARARAFAAQPDASGKWCLSGKKDRLYFHADLLPHLNPAAGELKVSYAQAVLNSHISYHHHFKEIRVNPGVSLFLERQPCLKAFSLDGDLLPAMSRIWQGGWDKIDGPPPGLDAIQDYECIRRGLQAYF